MSAASELESFPIARGLTPDSEYWLADGNVILVTGDVCFRVHRSVLCLASEFFRDLLSLPQPEEKETPYTIPAIDLQDSAADFRLLLRVLYSNRMNLGRGKQLTVTEVEAIARMAHKYQLDELRDDAVALLKTIFTDDWGTWDRLSQTSELSTPSLRCTPAEAILVVHTATVLNERTMLPIALYLCCQLPAHDLLAGAPGADGAPRLLPPEHLVRCIDGVATLVLEAATARTTMLARSGAECSRTCRAAFVAHVGRRGPRSLAPLACVDGRIDAFCAGRGVCADCAQEVKRRRNEYRRHLWERLPHLFDLDSWETLRAAAVS